MAKKKTAKKKEQPFTEVTTGQEQPAKKGLIEELEELKKNGETSTARYKDLLKEAEVIFGTGEMNSFGTNDPEALKERLGKMSKADLQTLSKKVGINPFYEKETVIDNIMKEFHRYQNRNTAFAAPQPIETPTLDPNNPQHKELIDWLNS